MNTFNLEFDVDTLNIILGALDELPHRISAKVIGNIHHQVQEIQRLQQSEQQENQDSATGTITTAKEPTRKKKEEVTSSQ